MPDLMVVITKEPSRYPPQPDTPLAIAGMPFTDTSLEQLYGEGWSLKSMMPSMPNWVGLASYFLKAMEDETFRRVLIAMGEGEQAIPDPGWTLYLER